MQDAFTIYGTLGALGILLFFAVGVLLGALWVIVPFAIFGIKPRLDRILVAITDLTRAVNQLEASRRRDAEETSVPVEGLSLREQADELRSRSS